MELKEKEIAKMRKEALVKRNSSIYDDFVYIHGERLEFVWQEVFPPVVKIMLPQSFRDLPAEFAKRRYSSEDRPEVIKTSTSLAANFAFNYFDVPIEKGEVIDCTRYYLGVMKQLYPGNDYPEQSEFFVDQEKRQVLGWYSFSNPTLAERVFNIHGFTNMEGKLLQIIFNTTEQRFEEWKPYVFEVFHSLSSGREKEDRYS